MPSTLELDILVRDVLSGEISLDQVLRWMTGDAPTVIDYFPSRMPLVVSLTWSTEMGQWECSWFYRKGRLFSGFGSTPREATAAALGKGYRVVMEDRDKPAKQVAGGTKGKA